MSRASHSRHDLLPVTAMAVGDAASQNKLGGSARHVRDNAGDRAVLRFVVSVVGTAAAIRHHRPATVQSQSARDDAMACFM